MLSFDQPVKGQGCSQMPPLSGTANNLNLYFRQYPGEKLLLYFMLFK